MAGARREQQANDEFERSLRRRKARERKEDLARERGKTYLFHIDMVDDTARASALELNEILGKVGVRFELSEQRFQSYEYNYLEITVREENVRNIRTRHAGRPQNPVLYIDPQSGQETYATIGKVEQLIENTGAIGAARILGMSKAGMYRRLGRSRAAAIPCDLSDEPLGNEDMKF